MEDTTEDRLVSVTWLPGGCQDTDGGHAHAHAAEDAELWPG